MSNNHLTHLTRDAVLGAIAECDTLGHATFLERHGYRPSARYVLVHRGRRYPSKAIVGVALGKTADLFSGGRATVVRALKRLGFYVKNKLKWLVDAVLQPLYLSVPPTKSKPHRKAVADRLLAVITTPMVGNRNVADWPIWAADNGCFAAGERFDLDRYLAWLERHREHAPRCIFATAPDVLCNALATWERSAPVLGRIRALAAALVAQNGIERLTIEWDAFDCLFVGGDDAFKDGPVPVAIVAEANRRGKWTHCGRVNSGRRMRLAAERGYDSVDGTFMAFGPDKNLPRLLSWYDGLGAQLSLALAS
jgi:hypothetical protein